MTAPLPDVFAYLDHRAFLRDWFDATKARDPSFSHRQFVRSAGFRSSSALHHVMRGERNLSSSSVDGVVAALGLDAEEAAFFRALTALDQARTDDERNQAWTLIAAERRFRAAHRLHGEAFRFLSHWYLPAIHQLAACADFVDDPAWIAARLRPRLDPAEVVDALETLEVLGLLVRDEDGRRRPRDVSVVTPPEVAGLAACNYHRQMSQRAHDSVALFDADERHLLGVTVAVPAHLVGALKQELNRMQARLLDLCDDVDGDADRVYQLNLQLVPLTTAPPES